MDFEIPEEYVDDVANFQSSHECPIRGKYQGAIGGQYTYSFTDTSIGTIIRISCACGKELVLTDHL